MGTSFMTYVVFGGVSRIAVLDHCDGDPELQGVRIFNLMSNPNNKKSLERGLERCRDVSAEIAQSDRTAYRWYDRYIEDHPSHIFCGGEQLLLQVMCTKEDVTVWNHLEDHRQEDWAYLIDLDAGTFEVYKGSNSSEPPVPGERFYDGNDPGSTGSYPFKLKATYRLGDMPSSDRFISDSEGWETDEERPKS